MIDIDAHSRRNTLMTRLPVLAAGVVAAALTIGGCGDDGTTAGSGTTSNPATTSTAIRSFNDNDVAFAQGMIPHHQQAIAMAQVAAERAERAQVKELASKIKQAQDPEIQTMTGWLTSWGKDVPESMPGMNHGGMPGMMSEAEMTSLEQASGTAFDRMFLDMMIKHHEGAIEMARIEQDKGENPDAVALAKKIQADQQA